MKQTAKVDDATRFVTRFVPRVAKLDKHKYAAWVDAHTGSTWEMALHAVSGQPVRICRKRKLARQAALALLAMVRKHDKSAKSLKSAKQGKLV